MFTVIFVDFAVLLLLENSLGVFGFLVDKRTCKGFQALDFWCFGLTCGATVIGGINRRCNPMFV